MQWVNLQPWSPLDQIKKLEQLLSVLIRGVIWYSCIRSTVSETILSLNIYILCSSCSTIRCWSSLGPSSLAAVCLAGSWQGAGPGGPGGPNQKLTSSNDHLRREQGEQDDDVWWSMMKYRLLYPMHGWHLWNKCWMSCWANLMAKRPKRSKSLVSWET